MISQQHKEQDVMSEYVLPTKRSLHIIIHLKKINREQKGFMNHSGSRKPMQIMINMHLTSTLRENTTRASGTDQAQQESCRS